MLYSRSLSCLVMRQKKKNLMFNVDLCSSFIVFGTRNQVEMVNKSITFLIFNDGRFGITVFLILQKGPINVSEIVIKGTHSSLFLHFIKEIVCFIPFAN